MNSDTFSFLGVSTHASMWVTENCFQKLHTRCIDCKSISHLCTVSLKMPYIRNTYPLHMYPHIKNAHFAIYFTSGSVFNFNGSQTVQCARTNSKTEIEEHEVLPLKISNMMSVRVASISVTQFIIWQNEGRRGVSKRKHKLYFDGFQCGCCIGSTPVYSFTS